MPGLQVTPENFRIIARETIRKFYEEGRVIDSLLWTEIVLEYERALGWVEKETGKL